MTPSPQATAPTTSPAEEQENDLLIYAGRLLATPTGLASAVLEYAHALARRGTADLVTLPIVHEGRPHEVRLLVGTSVPVAALSLSDREPSTDAQAAIEELRARIPRAEKVEAKAPIDDSEAVLYACLDWI